jgi:Uma2 family endonuclease
MSTGAEYIPAEVYLRSDEYEPAAEYVDGVIEERAAGDWNHSSWQGALLACFFQHKHEWQIRALPSLLPHVAPTRYRVPDVAIIDRALSTEQIITHAPLAVFEILSPEYTAIRLLRKLGDYAAMGIANIWLIDPETRTGYRFLNGGLQGVDAFAAQDYRFRVGKRDVEAFLD